MKKLLCLALPVLSLTVLPSAFGAAHQHGRLSPLAQKRSGQEVREIEKKVQQLRERFTQNRGFIAVIEASGEDPVGERKKEYDRRTNENGEIAVQIHNLRRLLPVPSSTRPFSLPT